MIDLLESMVGGRRRLSDKPGSGLKTLDSRDADFDMIQKIRQLAAKSKSSKPKKGPASLPSPEPAEITHNPIKWPADKLIQEVSQKLTRIKRLGMKYEQHNDYFNSGEFAYQIQEIIRTTNELFQKCQRVNQRMAP